VFWRLVIPRELEVVTQTFEKFYLDQHSGKKLTWLHNLAKGEVKTNYTTTNKIGYTLQGSGYQIGVLLHFNQNPELTMKDLVSATQIADNQLTQILRSLVKTKVLNCDELKDGSNIDPGFKFSLNKGYKAPGGKVKVNINVPMKAEEGAGGGGGGGGADKDVDSKQMAEILEERKLLMQAAIVRIMKARKKLKHNELITEVVDQLKSRFKPQIPLIKKCIDMLIEKEYLERVKGEKDMYSYLA